eukprot:TRINITY_DN22136_c0_g1_i3.p1 TRINITY_DN22136_c0_g1~~TRINITY_DN22136_c0_g1_i3.p1  ORF type:complete len:298 (-),score=47.60 TRINITY_DN22136_c0_g1_i3:144-986(-)
MRKNIVTDSFESDRRSQESPIRKVDKPKLLIPNPETRKFQKPKSTFSTKQTPEETPSSKGGIEQGGRIHDEDQKEAQSEIDRDIPVFVEKLKRKVSEKIEKDKMVLGTGGGPSDSMHEIQRMVEDAKDREERMTRQLQKLKERAATIIQEREHTGNTKKTSNEKELEVKISQTETHLQNLKDTMNTVFRMTKQTHDDVQRTKDLVANIQSDTTINRIYGSFHSKFVEDEDEEMFRDGNCFRLSGIDRTATLNDEDNLKYILTGEEDGSEDDVLYLSLIHI